MSCLASQTASAPLVSVYCMTYNHENTIAQAIEGIVSQQTDFAFELIVHDDASTDGTAAIVADYAERYPHIVRPILQQENQYHRYNLIRQFIHPIAKGRLIALCEGDDFWTDPQKLQIQADYMQSHPECSLCFHAVQQLSFNGETMNARPLKHTGDVPASLMVKRGGLFCSTVSSMFRRDVMECWPDFREMADVYDYPLQILAAVKGTVHYIDRTMAVYRFASVGSWTEQHADKVDYAHVENETAWLERFNRYTNGQYQTAVDYHLAHMWLTEYRKSFEPLAKQKVKAYIRRLPFKDQLLFGGALTAFSIGGQSVNRLFQKIKKQMLK